jgi:MOSC domain-containing protein YiiM
MAGVHLTTGELESGLNHIRLSPKDKGPLELIVCRPQSGERQVLAQGDLDLVNGLLGDNWHSRGNAKTPDGSANPDTQITIMNARCIALLAREKSRWPLAGDQLFIDLDLSLENLPPGSQLSIGSAIIEITPPPHTGCKKFVSRYGLDAMEFVNSPTGRQLNLRGVNARIRQPGTIKTGDYALKLPLANI